MSKKSLHESHADAARLLYRTRAILMHMFLETSVCFGKNSKEHRLAASALEKVDGLRSVLDSAYHLVTSEEQFKHAGHVYYKDWSPAALSQVRK